MPMIALCDCNNFFVSCERIYRPALIGKPVVVLSSNDGCIVSRSDEAKAMGIPMGEPYFRIEPLLRARGVIVCSGNLAMYKEVSSKVMRLLSGFTDKMEEYSIDEAFLDFGIAAREPLECASEIRRKVGRWVGIPVSIGLAATKTLSKLASDKAKKSEGGVFQITACSAKGVLDSTPVEEVWGIGRKSAAMLGRWGIFTAGDFARKDPLWVRKMMTVRGLMTQSELSGQPCLPLVTAPLPPKSIQVSRTWGSPLESFDDVRCAVMENVISAGQSLRKCRLAAGAMEVFIRHGYRHSGECGYFADSVRFGNPILSDAELVHEAMRMLGKIYSPGRRYTQGGVTLRDFCESSSRQRELWEDSAYERRAKHERLSRAVDMINERLGGLAIYPAALAAKDKKWRPRVKHLHAEPTVLNL
jgi:DNA polymerase V